MNTNISCLGISMPLLKEQLRRCWALPLLAFILYFATGTFGVMIKLDPEGGKSSLLLSRIICNSYLPYYALNLAVPIFSALLTFRHFHETGSASLIHAMPTTRSQLFHSSFLSGWFLCALPLLANNLLLFGMSRFLQGDYYAVDFVKAQAPNWLWQSLLIVSIAYGIAVFAGAVTGNLITHLFAAAGFHFLLPALVSLMHFYSACHLYGFTASSTSLRPIKGLAPVFTQTADGYTTATAACQLAAFLALYLCSLLLYRRRRLERTDSPLIFRFMEPVCCCIATFLGMSVLIFYLVDFLFRAPSLSIYLAAAGCSVLLYLMGRIIVEKSIQIFNRRTLKEFVLYAILAALVLTSFQTGGLGFENRVPSPEKMQTAFSQIPFPGTMEVSFTYADREPISLESPENKKALEAFHQSVLKHKKEFEPLKTAPRGLPEQVDLGYNLKNGRDLHRTYALPYAFLRSSKELKTVYESAEYKSKLPLSSMDLSRLHGIKLVRSHNTQTGLSSRTAVLDGPDEYSSFMTCLQKDIQAETFAELTSLRLPYATVTLNVSYPPEKGSSRTFLCNFDLPKSFSNTIDWLTDRGYDLQLKPKTDEIAYIAVLPNEKIQDSSEQQFTAHQVPAQSEQLMVITDPDRIYDLIGRCERDIMSDEGSYTLQIVSKDPGDRSPGIAFFNPDTVPDDIRDYFQ